MKGNKQNMPEEFDDKEYHKRMEEINKVIGGEFAGSWAM